MSNESPLSLLVSILSSSVKELESAYAKKGQEYPSLDARFTPLPDDAKELEVNPELGQLSRIVVAAAAQIMATVRAPMETIQEYSTGSYAAASLNLVVDVNVANILKDSGPQGMHIKDIALRADVPAERLGTSSCMAQD